MKSAAIERLLDINRRFYSEHGRDFSETRLRLQPGVKRLIESLSGDETILDLGCGNGIVAAALSRRGHRGEYLGVDLSTVLLDKARRESYGFPARFLQADLLQLKLEETRAGKSPTSQQMWRGDGSAVISAARSWSLVAAFALLHHIPGRERRLGLLSAVREWLEPDGRFLLSVWQLLGIQRLESRIQPWSVAGLAPEELDRNDFLLDWRLRSPGLRYVHQFDESELAELAGASGFAVVETFYSDGSNRRTGLYQIWRHA